MSLKRYLDIHTPLMWVVTDEPHRVTQEVLEHSHLPVYRLDPLQGLVVHDGERWRKVLVVDGDGQDCPVFDLQVALFEVLSRRGLIIVDYAHFSVEKMIPFYGSVVRLFLDAVKANNAARLPAQFVLLSCKDEIPVELAREATKVTYALPNVTELKTMAEEMHPAPEKVESFGPIVRAGQGLSEVEFISACTQSLNDKGDLDASVINHIKIDTIKSGGLLEVRTPNIALDQIGGLDRVKTLISQVAWTWNHPEEAKALGIEPLRRVLLIGVSGTGKSAICEATATGLALDLAKTGASQTFNKYVGESEANMRRVFTQVKAMEPIVLWIDEFGRDMSGSASSSSVDGGTTDRVHGEFLTGLQELPGGVFLMAAANDISGLPPEITRADRFDKVIFVGMPTMTEREEIFKIHLGEAHAEYDLNALASVTQHFTGAEIKQLVKEVRFNVGTTEHRAPTLDEFVRFAPTMKGRVWKNHHETILNMYRRAVDEWDWASSAQEKEAEQIIGGGTKAEVTAGHRPKPATVPSLPSFGIGSARGDL